MIIAWLAVLAVQCPDGTPPPCAGARAPTPVLVVQPFENRSRDTRRDNANLVQGTDTLRYGWPDTTEHRCRTAAEVAAVLHRRGWTGTLRPCSPGCAAAPPTKAEARTSRSRAESSRGLSDSRG